MERISFLCFMGRTPKSLMSHLALTWLTLTSFTWHWSSTAQTARSVRLVVAFVSYSEMTQSSEFKEADLLDATACFYKHMFARWAPKTDQGLILLMHMRMRLLTLRCLTFQSFKGMFSMLQRARQHWDQSEEQRCWNPGYALHRSKKRRICGSQTPTISHLRDWPANHVHFFLVQFQEDILESDPIKR